MAERDAGEVFREIYATDHWDGGSGVGSAADATAPYRSILKRLVAAKDIATVVDVGCGDWQLGSLCDWSAVSYTGIDVVPALVESCRNRFGSESTTFAVADARHDDLPPGDLLLVKDVLQHWPIADIEAFLAARLRRYRYALITNDIASAHWPGRVNEEIGLGAWRTVDLEAAPFARGAQWRRDYDVRGQWTKRCLLYVSPSWWPRSGLRRLRRMLPPTTSTGGSREPTP